MRRQLGRFGVLALVAGGLVAQGHGAFSVASAVDAAERLGARTGVVVRDVRGRELYAHRADEVFAPASNQKLLTALALLDSLGADYRFETRFSLRGGAFVVTSGGDPNLRSGSPFAAAAAFDAVTAQLRARGILAVRDLVLDAGTFTGPDRPDEWPKDQFHLDYCAPTSPWLLDGGLYRVRVEARIDGEAPRVGVIAPWDGARIKNDLRPATAKARAVYGAMNLNDVVTVHGRYGKLDEPYEFTAVMHEPRVWFESLLRWRLQAGGIAVTPTAEAPADQELAVWTSPLLPALVRVLEDSSNVDAEQCLRVLGARDRNDGSLAGGVAAVRAILERRIGGWPQGAQLRDGSGLSAGNRVTPRMLATLLAEHGVAATDHPFRECLPIGGQTGTLADRFAQSPVAGKVRAKTGWIRGASSLSGFVECEDGRVRYFSILMNYDPSRGGLNKDLKALQERIVEAIAQSGA